MTTMAELREIMAELARSQQETQVSLRELRDSMGELKQDQAETQRSLQETQESLRKLRDDLRFMSEESDRRLNKMAEDGERRLKKLEKLYGGVSDNSGRHAEEFFQNALRKTLTFGGIKFDELKPNLAFSGKKNCEFDMALTNGDAIAIIEARNRVRREYVQVLATKKLAQFRKFFPNYANYKIYLGLAGFSFEKAVYDEAKKYGVGVIRQDGDSVQVDAGELKVY